MSALVWFIPEERAGMVTIHDHWGADNGYETAVFDTKDEAVDFCWRRWKLVPKVIGPPAGHPSSVVQ